MATKIQRERAPGAGPNPAVDSRRVKRLLPTNLTSRQLELIAPEIRERTLNEDGQFTTPMVITITDIPTN